MTYFFQTSTSLPHTWYYFSFLSGMISIKKKKEKKKKVQNTGTPSLRMPLIARAVPEHTDRAPSCCTCQINCPIHWAGNTTCTSHCIARGVNKTCNTPTSTYSSSAIKYRLYAVNSSLPSTLTSTFDVDVNRMSSNQAPLRFVVR